jgi:hypothetical protein
MYMSKLSDEEPMHIHTHFIAQHSGELIVHYEEMTGEEKKRLIIVGLALRFRVYA